MTAMAVDENRSTQGFSDSCALGGSRRRNGVLDCNPTDPNAAPVCNADDFTAVDNQDLCDYQDDCDGTVDEDFVDNAGQYSTVPTVAYVAQTAMRSGTLARRIWSTSNV